MNKKEKAQALQKLQAKAGIDNGEFAKRAGVSIVTANNWLQGKNIRRQNINAVAEALEVDFDTIFDIYIK